MLLLIIFYTMSSGSYTILPYINPPAHYTDVTTAVTNINLVDNGFTVPQTMAGIIDSANLTVAGTSRFTGKATFDTAPDFLAGINVAISEVDTGTLVVSGSSSLNGGLTVVGSLVLPNSSVIQSMVSSGYVDLSNAQTIAGIKTLSSPPVMSGASISSASIPDSALSANNALLNSVQTFTGAKTFSSAVTVPAISASGLISGSAGLTISAGASAVQALTATGVTAPTFTGDLVGNASTASLAQTVNIITDNTVGTYYVPFVKSNVSADSLYVDDVTTPLLTYNPSTGLLSAGAVTSAGAVIIGSGGLNVTGSIVYNTSIGSVVNTANDVTIALGGVTFGTYSTTPSANVNTLTITGASVCATFDLLIAPSAAITWRKAMSSGGVTIYNNLAGNQAMASGSRWWVRGKCLSATIVYLDIINVT